MPRRVAIIGTGQTKYSKERNDVNQMELVYKATTKALDDAELKVSDLDAIVLGNMELFEGRALPEMWCGEGAGGYLKSVTKIATGGTSGSSAAIAGFYQVASGVFDIVVVVGWEKHSEGHTQTAMAMVDPLWDRHVASGAVGNFALSISQLMAGRGITEEQAAKVTVKARRNACRNPYAHLQMPDITVEEVLSSRMLAHPVRLLDMCPQSDGACAIIYASEERARTACRRPAWVKAVATRHEQPYLGDIENRLIIMRTLRAAAKEAYRQAGISQPLRDLNVAEIYEPVSYAELAWYEALGFCDEGEAGKLIDEGITEMGGQLPVNPSGGVLCSNPVGASGVIRVAEAAIQIMSKGEERQVPGVKTALAHGYGVYAWADVMILSSELG
ncbi:MAG: thiolase family protein [Chloroflexi bacterium]|nr:thiolase family protein [Chloroflexota bacterium]